VGARGVGKAKAKLKSNMRQRCMSDYEGYEISISTIASVLDVWPCIQFYDIPASTPDLATHMEDLVWQYPSEPIERAAVRFCEAVAKWRGKPELETVSLYPCTLSHESAYYNLVQEETSYSHRPILLTGRFVNCGRSAGLLWNRWIVNREPCPFKPNKPDDGQHLDRKPGWRTGALWDGSNQEAEEAEHRHVLFGEGGWGR
jgi:hypothetical protein